MLACSVISIFLQLGLSGPAGGVQPQDTVKASLITEIKAPVQNAVSMSRKDLDKLTATSVADAARYFGGVQVKDYGGVGGLKTVNVRSLGSHHTGVVYNGINITNAQNGQVDLGRFALDNVGSIALYHGQKAELLQTASELAAASTIYIKSLVPEKTGVSASFRTGAFATINPSVQATYNGRVKLSANAAWLSTDGRYRFTFHMPAYDTTATRYNGDLKALRAELNLYYKGLSVGGWWYNSERGLPGPVIRRVSDQYNSADRQWDRNAFLQASWKKTLAPGLQFLLNGKYGYDYCRYLQDPSKNAAVMPLDNTYRQREAYLSAAMSYNVFDWLGAGLALDGRLNSFSSECKYPAAAVIPEAERLSGLAAFQVTAVPLAYWHIQASLLYTMLRDKAGEAGKWHIQTKPTPYVAISYEGIKTLSISCGYKENFREPTFNDLYYTIGGRTKLEPEYARQLDAAASWLAISERRGTLRSLSLSAGYYMAKVWNKITAIPGASQFRWSVINYGLARIAGLDLSAQAEASVRDFELRLRASYSHEDARDRTDAGSPWYGGRLAYSPQHSGSLVASLAYKGFGASVSWLYTGKRYSDSANIPENRLEPWYTTDLSISWSFMAGRTRTRITADINNLLDQDYEVVTRYPMPGRHILIKVNIEI